MVFDIVRMTDGTRKIDSDAIPGHLWAAS